jgi:uncharacterized protein
MPLRTLLILIALAIIVMAARRLLAGRQAGGRRLKQSGSMVQCATCGMYVPEDEAIADSGRHYCSRKHLDEDSRHS